MARKKKSKDPGYVVTPREPTETWEGTLEPVEGAPYAAAEVVLEAGEITLARSYRPKCSLLLPDGSRPEIVIPHGGLPGWPGHDVRSEESMVFYASPKDARLSRLRSCSRPPSKPWRRRRP